MRPPTPDTPPPTPLPTQSGRMIPFLVGCALFMQMLDSTIVATALPAMAVALGTDPVQLNIAITSYLLAVAVFVPISGWAADRFGARRVFILAICIFTLSSLTCALSLSVLQLVISRTMQGVGGAMMVPVGRIILLRTFPKHELLKAMAFLSLPALVGPIIAPPLGGFLVTYASWHWIFLINVPIGAIGVRLVMLHIREFEPDGKDHPLDVLGFLLSASFMAALVWGFASLGRPGVPLWSSMAIIVFGVASAVVFVWHARRHADPILDLSLLNIPTFEIATLADLKRAGGRDVVRTVVALFEEAAGEAREELRAAAGDGKQLAALAHRQRGTAACVGARRLAASLTQLEAVAKAGDRAASDAAIERIGRELDEALRVLARYRSGDSAAFELPPV